MDSSHDRSSSWLIWTRPVNFMLHTIDTWATVSFSRKTLHHVTGYTDCIYLFFLSLLNLVVLKLVREVAVHMREIHKSVLSFLSAWHILNFGLPTLAVIWYEISVEGQCKLPVHHVRVTETILWHCYWSYHLSLTLVFLHFFLIGLDRVNCPEYTLWFTLLAVSDERRKAEDVQWRLTFI